MSHARRPGLASYALALAGALLLTLPARAQSSGSAASSAAAASTARPTMVRAMGYHRGSDSGIWIWRGNERKLRTTTHELLHRASRDVPRVARVELARLTNDREINEGLTSYLTSNALAKTGRSEAYPNPVPGTPFGALRTWARGLRTAAQAAIRDSYGVAVETSQIAVLSDRSFGRAYARDFGKAWESYAGQPGVYGNSKSKVQELVELVGERPVVDAYFRGELEGLKRGLRAAQRRSPSTFPSWISL